MIDVEILLARTLGWDIYAMDQADFVSLLEFVARFLATKGGTQAAPRRVFCDQAEANWLNKE